MTDRWRAALRAAARLGVPPAAFWKLSVAEWRTLATRQETPVMSRDELRRLMDEHPDR